METRENEWDDEQRAAILSLLEWQHDLHTCGRPLSESLHTDGRPDPSYVIGERGCLACKALDAHVEKHHKDGLKPQTLINIYTRDEARAVATAQRQKGDVPRGQ